MRNAIAIAASYICAVAGIPRLIDRVTEDHTGGFEFEQHWSRTSIVQVQIHQQRTQRLADRA